MEARVLPSHPVHVTLNGKAAELLVRLTAEMSSEDPSGVLVRALGLLDLAQRTRRQGGRLQLVNARGEPSDVAF